MRDNKVAALHDLAQREYRATKAQAVWTILKDLEKLGLTREVCNTSSFKSGNNR